MLGTQRKIPELHTTRQSLTTKEQEEGGAAVEVSVFAVVVGFFFTWKEWLQIQPKRINYYVTERDLVFIKTVKIRLARRSALSYCEEKKCGRGEG